MKIHNIRAGFATNSSSSHSIVMLPAGVAVTTDEYEPFNYNWEQFTLADTESKTRYLAAQLRMAMQAQEIPVDTCTQLINSWLGTTYNVDHIDQSNVDHQSHWDLFRGSLGTNPRFVAAFHAWLQQQNVVILGGNDNSDPQPAPPGSMTNAYTMLPYQSGHNLRVREDQDYWVLFNTRTGDKIRLSFDPQSATYAKSSTPELVDVKLTNFCASTTCVQWCYQGSNRKGVHADWHNVKTTLEALAQLDVFEVAFGGGETTQYPHLADTLNLTGELGMVANFTTYSDRWLNNKALLQAVRANTRAIGVSVHDVHDLAKVNTIKTEINFYLGWSDPTVTVTAQHVVGTLPMSDTAALLEQCWQQGIPILLLGYKHVGAGADHMPYDQEGIDVILRLQSDRSRKPKLGSRFWTLGVDTQFVNQFGGVLRELNISPVLITSEEGAHSMYVDCVTCMQGPSSYAPMSMQPVDMNNVAHSIRSAFATF